MVSRDYTKEVGLPSADKIVPKPIAIIIFIALALGVWYTVATLAKHSAEGPVAHVQSTAH